MTLLAELVETSGRVASTRARSAKVAALADLLRRLAADEVEPTVAILSGEARQGRIGVGWATLSAVSAGPAGQPSLTVANVDSTLDRIAALGGPGSEGTRAAALHELFTRATAPEADFLRRLLVGELRQGALAGVMTDAVANAAGVTIADVRRAAMLAGDPCRVAALALSGGSAALAAVGLRPLHPVLPMLAASSPDPVQALAATGRASVEWKLDGARIQLHRDGDEVRIFTRNLNDVTDRLPGIVGAARAMPATCFILDGEALGWLEDGERPDRFQEVMSRFGRHDGVAGGTLAARFFDCLHLDGEDLLDLPLTERAEALDQVAGPYRVPSILTDDPSEAAAFFERTVAAGHEGVMVKAAASRYEAGRRGGAWRKVKPVQTFDLVVLGAEWGHGRRRGWLSNLHLGARRDGAADDFVMVGKTFKGLTDELLTWQTTELLARETGREGIAVYVRPELVVEVALDGVQSSTRYPGGIALRFARVKRYRPEKIPAEADALAALRALLG
jgi:DNA ligase-1